MNNTARRMCVRRLSAIKNKSQYISFLARTYNSILTYLKTPAATALSPGITHLLDYTTEHNTNILSFVTTDDKLAGGISEVQDVIISSSSSITDKSHNLTRCSVAFTGVLRNIPTTATTATTAVAHDGESSKSVTSTDLSASASVPSPSKHATGDFKKIRSGFCACMGSLTEAVDDLGEYDAIDVTLVSDIDVALLINMQLENSFQNDVYQVS